MSQQTMEMGTRVYGRGVAEIIEAVFGRVSAAVRTSREVQARSVVRAVVRRYSDSELARFGWSAADIRRLKSNQ